MEYLPYSLAGVAVGMLLLLRFPDQIFDFFEVCVQAFHRFYMKLKGK